MMTKDQRYHFLVDSAVDSMSEQLIEDFHLPVPEALSIFYIEDHPRSKNTSLYRESRLFVSHLKIRIPKWQVARNGVNVF